jgi:choline kinase
VPVAIILAAGRGGRLGPLTAEKPKCLLRVGTGSLLDHQLDALRVNGVESVVVVAGYCAEAVEAELAGRASLLLNPRHAETNSLYSLWLARQHAQDGFVLLNADVLFDRRFCGGAGLAAPRRAGGGAPRALRGRKR